MKKTMYAVLFVASICLLCSGAQSYDRDAYGVTRITVFNGDSIGGSATLPSASFQIPNHVVTVSCQAKVSGGVKFYLYGGPRLNDDGFATDNGSSTGYFLNGWSNGGDGHGNYWKSLATTVFPASTHYKVYAIEQNGRPATISLDFIITYLTK